MRIVKPAILLLAAMAFFVFGKWYFNQSEKECITRAQTARMLAYGLYDGDELTELAGKRSLIDVEEGLWYTEEIEAIAAEGMMKTDGDLFHPTECLTYGEAGAIAEKFQIESKIPMFMGKRPIPLEKWLAIYEEIISIGENVEIKYLTIEKIPAVSDELKPWEIQTDQGIFIGEGLSMETLLGQRVRAYVCGDQLLMAVKQNENDPGAEIIEAGTAKTGEDMQEEPAGESETIQAEPDTGSTNEQKEETAILDDAVTKLLKQDIRVCLMTTGFTSEYHEKVTLTADSSWSIAFDNGIRQCRPGETVTWTAEDFSEDGTAQVTADGQGRLQVLSIERGNGCPDYEGRLSVIRSGGSLILVNLLPLEDYLCGVVPGEMPAGYGEEALKAQAVCARSFACLAMQSPKYDFADVNDSTACQVYMNQGTDERCSLAVEATAGQLLVYNDEIVTAKYFSTSCGSLSDSRDIWLYPGEVTQTGHLLSGLELWPQQQENGTDTRLVPALADETAFRTFIDSPGENYVEDNEPWFRWQVTLKMDDIGAAMEKYLGRRMDVNPKHFTVLSSDGEINSDDVKQVEILERADSGVVKKIRISGDDQALTVSGEYNIRCLLSAPDGWSVELQDGTEVQGLSLLPSGYFYLEELEDENEEGDVRGYRIHGGGLGHGSGMSQNGARCLAGQGYDYEEILAYYFDGIKVIGP